MANVLKFADVFSVMNNQYIDGNQERDEAENILEEELGGMAVFDVNINPIMSTPHSHALSKRSEYSNNEAICSYDNDEINLPGSCEIDGKQHSVHSDNYKEIEDLSGIAPLSPVNEADKENNVPTVVDDTPVLPAAKGSKSSLKRKMSLAQKHPMLHPLLPSQMFH